MYTKAKTLGRRVIGISSVERRHTLAQNKYLPLCRRLRTIGVGTAVLCVIEKVDASGFWFPRSSSQSHRLCEV